MLCPRILCIPRHVTSPRPQRAYIEGEAGKADCPSQDAQVQAGGGAGAAEPAEWDHDRGDHGGDRLAGAFQFDRPPPSSVNLCDRFDL
jgi:hypothetical protein